MIRQFWRTWLQFANWGPGAVLVAAVGVVLIICGWNVAGMTISVVSLLLVATWITRK